MALLYIFSLSVLDSCFSQILIVLLTPSKFRFHKKLLALVDDHLCVGFKAQFVTDDSAQVYRCTGSTGSP